jgi:hypothetical protein
MMCNYKGRRAKQVHPQALLLPVIASRGYEMPHLREKLCNFVGDILSAARLAVGNAVQDVCKRVDVDRYAAGMCHHHDLVAEFRNSIASC